MNRGSAARARAGVVELSRFNEAPIHESGKFQHGRSGQRLPHASMRPRFMNRGSWYGLPRSKASR